MSINVLAAEISVGDFELPGPLGTVSNPGDQFNEVISISIGAMTAIAFIWFIVQFFIAAIQIIGSGGDKAALSAAKSKLTTSVIGVVVVISAIFLIELIGFIFGFSILDSITTLLGDSGGLVIWA